MSNSEIVKLIMQKYVNRKIKYNTLESIIKYTAKNKDINRQINK